MRRCLLAARGQGKLVRLFVMGTPMGNAVRVLIMAVAAAALLSGCGVRGSLEAPPEARAAGTNTSGEPEDPGKDSAATPKPHRGFILDGLL